MCSNLSQASFYLGNVRGFLHSSENQATWDSDLFIPLRSVILVNNAKGRVTTSNSQAAVCIVMVIHTAALQSKQLPVECEPPFAAAEPWGLEKGLWITLFIPRIWAGLSLHTGTCQKPEKYIKNRISMGNMFVLIAIIRRKILLTLC